MRITLLKSINVVFISLNCLIGFAQTPEGQFNAYENASPQKEINHQQKGNIILLTKIQYDSVIIIQKDFLINVKNAKVLTSDKYKNLMEYRRNRWKKQGISEDKISKLEGYYKNNPSPVH